MGKFALNENIYVMGKITEVDPSDSTRYRLQTNLAKFYVTEKGDTLRSNPAEVFTAEELYMIFIAVNNMSPEDVSICFGEGYSNVSQVLSAGFSIEDIRRMYAEWQFGNELNTGDMVYYTDTDIRNPVYNLICTVLGVNMGDDPETATDNSYILFSDETNEYYTTTRAHISPAYKRSDKVIQALTDLDEATEEARKEIG